jgi:dienelactone hydrolase
MAIMGWSLGGIVSIFTASQRDDFKVLIDQAGGALSWKHSPDLQSELPRAASQVKAPSLCMDAENDATTDAVTTVGRTIRNAGVVEKTIIYPAFTPSSNPSNTPPGHLIFSAQGMSIWQNDVLSFLGQHIGADFHPEPPLIRAFESSWPAGEIQTRQPTPQAAGQNDLWQQDPADEISLDFRHI